MLILAAGQSSRMLGKDKLLEPVQGQPLLRRQALMALGLEWPVLVALPPEPHPRYGALNGLKIETLETADSVEGMGGSLRQSFANLPQDTRSVLLLLGDLPDIEIEDLKRVVAARDAHPEAAIWRGATTQGAAGHPILFSQATFPYFSALTGDDGGKSVIAAFKDSVHLVPLPGDRARRDLDTPEDWAQWRAQQQ